MILLQDWLSRSLFFHERELGLAAAFLHHTKLSSVLLVNKLWQSDLGEDFGYFDGLSYFVFM